MSRNIPYVRQWLKKLQTNDQPLQFSSPDELSSVLSLYDQNALNVFAYHLEKRFKEGMGSSGAPGESCGSKSYARSKDEEKGRYLDVDGSDKIYVATQHPHHKQMYDFWSTVLKDTPTVILMLNRYEYDHCRTARVQVHRYWPEAVGESVVFGSLPGHPPDSIQVTCLHTQIIHTPGHFNPERDGDFEEIPNVPEVLNTTADVPAPPPTPTDTSPLPDACSNDAPSSPDAQGSAYVEPACHIHTSMDHPIDCALLEVMRPGTHPYKVWHVRFGAWVDQEAPDMGLFLRMWRLVEEKMQGSTDDAAVASTREAQARRRMFVHCTGGIGRTGTFIAVDIAGHLLYHMSQGRRDALSIDAIVSSLRQQNPDMVGCVDQYIFCHRAALKMLDEVSMLYPHHPSHPSSSTSMGPPPPRTPHPGPDLDQGTGT